MLVMGEPCMCGGKSVPEISVPSSQFWCESTIALKSKVYFLIVVPWRAHCLGIGVPWPMWVTPLAHFETQWASSPEHFDFSWRDKTPTPYLPTSSQTEPKGWLEGHWIWSCLSWGYFQPAASWFCHWTLGAPLSTGWFSLKGHLLHTGKQRNPEMEEREEAASLSPHPAPGPRQRGEGNRVTDLPPASAAQPLSWPPFGANFRLFLPTDLQEGARKCRNELFSLEKNLHNTVRHPGLNSQTVICRAGCFSWGQESIISSWAEAGMMWPSKISFWPLN